jgi:hypothetical protein
MGAESETYSSVAGQQTWSLDLVMYAEYSAAGRGVAE